MVFLHQRRISHLHVVMNKIYNFPKKSELPKFILLVKISWLVFPAVSMVEMKNLQRSEQAHFPRLVATRACLIVLQFSPALQREPARRLGLQP